MHLVYLGFCIFLRLKCHPPIDVNILPTLGVVTSEDPNVLAQLTVTNIKQEEQLTGTTQLTPLTRPATAAAGSAAQLAHVKVEMKLEILTLTLTATSEQPKGTHPTPIARWEPQVTKKPFSDNIVRLSLKEINKHTGQRGKTIPDLPRPGLPKLKKKQTFSISVRKLTIEQHQSVTVAKPSQPVLVWKQPVTTQQGTPVSPAVIRAKTCSVPKQGGKNVKLVDIHHS